MDSSTISRLEEKAQYLRNQILDMCIEAGTGHVTSSFSCVEILVALYYGGIMRFDAARPDWAERDRFILSKGQASPLVYVVLADLGFFPEAHLRKFCKPDGPFGVHLQHDVPGVEITAGSLGLGFGIAAGMALAARMDNRSYSVFALLGDGECYEGSIWETAMFAGHHRLDNLVAIIDRNWFCVTDNTENLLHLDPLNDRWSSFGWETVKVNGHSIPELVSALEYSDSRKGQPPLLIIADTVKGKGISFMENVPLWHGVAPKGEEAERAKRELSRKVAKYI